MATEGGGGRRRAAEGGGGSSVDVLDVPIMCGRNSPSFPYNPTVGIVQRQKSRFLPPVETMWSSIVLFLSIGGALWAFPLNISFANS